MVVSALMIGGCIIGTRAIYVYAARAMVPTPIESEFERSLDET